MYKKIIVFLLIFISLATPIYAVDIGHELDNINANKYNKVDVPELSFVENNALKIWSVCKAQGMTDNQAAGVLGVFQVESGLDPAAVEGIFEVGFTERKQKLFKNRASLVKYTTDNLFKRYENQGTELYKDIYKGTDGKYYPAVGLGQFTGERFSKLLSYAEYHKIAWYEMDNQLAYFFKETDKSGFTDGHGKWIAETYIKDTKASVDECTAEWLRVFEGVANNKKEQRQELARNWLKKFKGKKGDTAYAKKIMDLMGKPYVGTSGVATTDIADISMFHELASKVLIMDRNAGFSFDFDNKKEKEQKTANSAILNEIVGKGNSNKKYSLYDLFGSDIHYYRYLGESTTSLTLLDHAFSYFIEGRLVDLSLGDTIFYDSGGRYLSTHVYKGRPLVLNSDILLQGSVDPRVSSIGSYFTGLSYTQSEFLMTGCKFITDFTIYMLGPEPIKHIGSFVEDILSAEIFKNLKPVILVFLGFAMVGFLISLVKTSFSIAKGRAALKHLFLRALVGILLIGGTFAFIASPTKLNVQVIKAATVVDNIFNEVIAKTYENDDVIGSTDGTNATAAAIWKTAIFQPWCQGVFGDKYENLYTQYSDKPNKMKQSYIDEDGLKNIKAGQYTYNSAKYTGDVYVPVGNNNQIRNWAAYLYSCQSMYHKDYDVAQIQIQEDEEKKEYIFPFAKTTARNANINADTFRVIDAQMDISPQVYSADKAVYNYTGAKRLENHYLKYTSVMIFNVLMLLFFWPVIFKKLSSLMKILLFAVQFVYYTIMELFREGKNVKDLFSNLRDNALQFLLASIKIFILTLLYTTLVGNNIMFTILYIFLAFNVLATTPTKVISKAKSVKATAVRYKNEFMK